MSSYARSLRRALSLRRPAPVLAVELPAAEEADPKLRALEATAPQLLDPKLAPERDDEAPRSIEASEVPLEERWTFDNPPPWHRQFTVRPGGLGGQLVCNLCTIVMWQFGVAAPPSCFRPPQSCQRCSEQLCALAGARHGGRGGRLRGAEFHHHQGAFECWKALSARLKSCLPFGCLLPRLLTCTCGPGLQLELTTGIMPSLSMATSLIAFGLLKAYTALLTRLGWHHAQFTPQVCASSVVGLAPCTVPK